MKRVVGQYAFNEVCNNVGHWLVNTAIRITDMGKAARPQVDAHDNMVAPLNLFSCSDNTLLDLARSVEFGRGECTTITAAGIPFTSRYRPRRVNVHLKRK